MQTWPKIGYAGNRTINVTVPYAIKKIYYHFAMRSTCLAEQTERGLYHSIYWQIKCAFIFCFVF